MKLTYRGVGYESNHPENTVSIPVVDLKYRGATYRSAQAAHTQALNSILKNRGAAYNSQPAVETTSVPTSGTVESSVQNKARFLTLNHHRTVKTRQQTILNRSAAELGLGASVRNYWNHIQEKFTPPSGRPTIVATLPSANKTDAF